MNETNTIYELLSEMLKEQKEIRRELNALRMIVSTTVADTTGKEVANDK